MTTPAERPSPEIRKLVSGLIKDVMQHAVRPGTSDYQIAYDDLMAALGAMEEDKKRLDFLLSKDWISDDDDMSVGSRASIDTALNAGGRSR